MNLDDALRPEGQSPWTRFLGTGLPARTLDLRFDCLLPRGSRHRPDVDPQRVRTLYATERENPWALLATITEHARLVNRSRVSIDTRFELAEIGLAAVAGTGRGLVTEQLARRGGVPEESGHREALTAISTALRVLLTAYELVFQTDYGKGRFWYVRARRRVHQCAHRLLEVIGMIQHVSALRYQRLDGDLWRTANTVYRVMLDYELVEIPQDTVGALVSALAGRQSRSIQDLYAALQVPEIIGCLTWPEALFPFALDYCRLVRDGVRLLPSDGSACGEFQILTGCYADREPTREPIPENLGPAILIDYANLALQARADFDQLRQARTTRNPRSLPRRFAPLHPSQLLAAGYLLMGIAERRPLAWTAPGSRPAERDLRIHTSFPDVYDHLLAIFETTGRVAATRELSDMFAQRSAAIGEDHTATEASLWYVLQEAPDYLRLHTQETRFTHRLTIGSFLAYGVGETGIRRPRLGKVTRIQRPDTGMVQVDVTIIADYARPGAIRPFEGTMAPNVVTPTAAPIRVLLTYGDAAGWGLLLPDQAQFWEDSTVLLISGDKDIRLELGELRDLGEGYCLFRLKARLDQGVRPAYPTPPAGNAAGTDAVAAPADQSAPPAEAPG